MAGDRSLTPSDATVAVRSFPRRFRAVFASPEDDEDRVDPDEAARRPGTDGRTAAEHLQSAIALIEALPDRGDADAGDDGTPVSSLLDRLQRSADAAAARIDDVPNEGWDGRLEATQDGVAAVAVHLRAATDVLRQVT